jgi:hypothetical protein
MQKAFPWLVGFIISQLVLICLAAMPLEYWRSFRTQPTAARGRTNETNFVPPELAVKTLAD